MKKKKAGDKMVEVKKTLYRLVDKKAVAKMITDKMVVCKLVDKTVGDKICKNII